MHCFRSPVGGLFRHVCDQVRYQHASGMAVGIICDQDTGGDQAFRVLDDFKSNCELGIHRIPTSRAIGPSDWLSYKRILSICRTSSPDILHGHGAKGGAFARLVAHRGGALAVYTPHGGSLHYANKSPAGIGYFSIERLLRNKTDGVIFESRFAEQTYLSKIGKLDCPYRIIPNGLTEDEFVPLTLAADSYDFVFVGEIRWLKGLRTLLDATVILRDRRNFRLLIVGDGPQREWCLKQINRRRLHDIVDVAKPTYPGRLAFARGRCMVVPSLHESFPYIVLEASGAGQPIIASDAGGTREIFGPQSNMLVPPGDPRALATAMARFLNDPQKANEVAEYVRQYVAKYFRVDQMAQQTVDFYLEIG